MVAAWVLLLAAIGVEVAATAALPRTQSFRDPAWTAFVITGYVVAIGLLSFVVRYIPVSVTYAIWAGLGTAGIALVGVVLLGEDFDLLKGVALAMIITGVVMLNLNGAH
jgi:small multidrug resistance pump